MSEERNQTGIKFLDDSPVTKDELKLHENIAKTIESIISLTKDKNKKIIGLFGSWGSGKSTVIEMLKNDIGNKKVFIFDSWSHKGDFLKRAFLLELARHFDILEKEIDKNSIVLRNNKALTIEDVLTRKVVSKQISIDRKSKFRGWVKFFSIIFILSIIIIAISNILKGIYLLFSPFSKLNIMQSFEIVFSLILISMLVLIAPLKFFQYKDEIEKGIKDFIDFYILKNAKIDESHTTKEDLEFTNYDYENYLKYILNKASLNEEEPFIIVFDNLDRVDDETVLNTLSLIQLTNEVLKENKNIYFIIPIDKERLEKTIKTIIAGESNNEPEKEKFAKDFLEKIFPYKINIPDIKHSNWRKFFKEKIQEAFKTEITEDDISFIRRVFEKSINNSREKNLTPREIKNFINSLVENYLYWQNVENKPDIKLQALYVSLYNYFPNEFKECMKDINKLRNCVEDSNSKCKFKDILEIAKEEFSEKEIKEALLKQYYKVEEIYVLFIDTSIHFIENEEIENLKGIVDLFEDKYKVEQLLDEIWEQKDEFRRDINFLLKFYNALKEIGFYHIYKHKIEQTLTKIINNIDALSKLEENHINEFSEILNTNENIKKLFIEKSAEIITTIPEEEKNE